MKYVFLKNIKKAVANYFKVRARIKLEWVYHNALGQFDNKLDEKEKELRADRHMTLFI
jgi:hypothetical protein